MPPNDVTGGLRGRLVDVIPREQSGAETAERYEYQLHWALRELLRRHRAGQNYCLLLEYFDDVVMLDDDVDPQHADFYQVKTKRSGHWTVSDLTRRGRKDGTELSAIGKMYAHRIDFPGESIALHFMSNVPMKVKLADGTSADAQPSVHCRDLPADTTKRLTQAVRKDHGLADDAPVDLTEITAFLFCEFGPTAAPTHVLGELETFLDALFPLRKVRTTAVYQAVLAELRRRNNCRTRPASFGALIELHGMSRQEFERLMQAVGAHDDPAEDWRSIEAMMQTEAWPIAEQMRVKTAWRRYVADRTNYEDRQLLRLRAAIRPEVDACQRRDDLTLRGMVHFLLAPIRRAPSLGAGYSLDYLTAVALAELMTNDPERHELPTVDSTPSANGRSNGPEEGSTADATRTDDRGHE
jgi:hypothetical protein